MDEIERIGKSSQYLATLLRRNADYRNWLWADKNIYRKYPLTATYEDLQNNVQDIDSFDELLRAFRRFKQRHFLRIGGRDLLGLAGLPETMNQLTDLAVVALQVGIEILNDRPNWCFAKAETRTWKAIEKNIGLVVMGLGKLGGHELNYVSDIDILFLHERREKNVPISADYVVLLNRFCSTLSRLIAEKVDGDRVFEVDHRLRPLGKDGPLIPSLGAALDHYLHNGRPWERQMLLKARPIAGDRPLGAVFLQEVRPFIFRRFLDFQALDELHIMRDRILSEGIRPDPAWRRFDVKLGIGGIREVEFLVQSLQLIYGGRYPELDEPNTLVCLQRLGELNLLTEDEVRNLSDAYIFLRRLEHWVQLDQNRQTQKLPQSQEARARLSFALGFGEDERGLLERLQDCCATVHGHFLALFRSRSASQSIDAEKLDERRPKNRMLDGFPHERITGLKDFLRKFPSSFQRILLDTLAEYAELDDLQSREKALVRLERYVTSVSKRPGLIKVFECDSSWLKDLCSGLAQSELLSDLLGHHPGLIEGIATCDGKVPKLDSWKANSLRLLHKVGGYEEGLEWIRRLKNERLLQLILADLGGEIEHQLLEEELSAVADLVIRETYQRVLGSRGLERLPLAILALGKLGSREMSYLSDLDLVFVYHPKPSEPDDRIPGDVLKLVQRFMRMLSTPLQEGPGYAVDARLRPTGNYGPLIVTRRAWQEYYLNEADLWEIQALTRIRPVAGDPELRSWMEDEVRKICYQQRDPSRVWPRLCHLRKRMEKERAEEKHGAVDIKLGMGGLADIEFFVQGHLLVDGYRDSTLRCRSVRAALSRLVAKMEDVDLPLRDAQTGFHLLRSLEHRLALHTNFPTSQLRPEQFESMKALRLWPPSKSTAELETWKDILYLRRRIRRILQHRCPEL